MLSRFGELELLKSRGKQRTDSTHILATVRTLSRLELIGETLRYALNAIAAVAPEWLKQIVPNPDWYERYGQRFQDSHEFSQNLGVVDGCLHFWHSSLTICLTSLKKNFLLSA
jgi:hypothetical protein